MKHLYIPILMLLLLASCRPAQRPPEAVRVQKGDIILVSLPMDYWAEKLPAEARPACPHDEPLYIHAAIADVEGDSLYIIDATLAHGVDRHPLEVFLKDFTLEDGSLPRMDVLRLKDDREAARYADQAGKLCGRAYDADFLLDNEALYCTELVRDAYVSADGDTLFGLEPITFRNPDGVTPPYWTVLFQLIQKPIPEGLPGLLPEDLMQSPLLEPAITDWRP